MNTLEQIFNTNNPLIGMIHFPPLVGYKDYPGLDYIKNKAVKEAKILEQGGLDAIMVENNYDTPHVEFVPKEITNMMIDLTKIVCNTVRVPVGISTLWNDYRTSLNICQATRANFFRVPAFVDTVKTSYGIMHRSSREVVSLRREMGLEHIAILADIQVKHSEMLDRNKTLQTSIKQAIEGQADAIIITGKWTGDSPSTSDLETARKTAKEFPILIGSGATIDNLPILLKYADGIIVGTTLKEGEILLKEKEINLKSFHTTISPKKTKLFIQAAAALLQK